MSVQARLLDMPIAGVYPIGMVEANAFLRRASHALGPVQRPFRSEAFGLEVAGELVAVAVSASAVSAHITRWTIVDGKRQEAERFDRHEVVELARLAASERWASRVMLRLWREVCAPLWQSWPVRAAVSYSQNTRHEGTLYRFDGWELWTESAGSSGGGTYSSRREAGHAAGGSKRLWVWRYGAAS